MRGLVVAAVMAFAVSARAQPADLDAGVDNGPTPWADPDAGAGPAPWNGSGSGSGSGPGGPDAGPVVVDGPSLVDVARPQASASVSPSQLQLGETCTLFVEVVFDDRVMVNLPSTLDLAPVFDELRRTSRDERRTDGTTKRTYQIELRAWELGELNLPPIQIGYAAGGQRSWVVTNSVPMRIVGLLGDVDDKTALIADTPPVSLRRRDWRLPLVAAVVLALIAVAGVAYWLRKRKPAVVVVPAALPARAPRARLPGAAERALAALAALEKAGTMASEPRAGYEQAVAILRRFWHEQFGVGIRDRTSAELVRALGKTKMPGAALAASERWLAACDLVKYAAVEPDGEHVAGDLAGARGLVYAAVSAAPPATAVAPRSTEAAS